MTRVSRRARWVLFVLAILGSIGINIQPASAVVAPDVSAGASGTWPYVGFTGGHGLLEFNSALPACSLGPIVRKNNNIYVTTAAHCLMNESNIGSTGDFRVSYRSPSFSSDWLSNWFTTTQTTLNNTWWWVNDMICPNNGTTTCTGTDIAYVRVGTHLSGAAIPGYPAYGGHVFNYCDGWSCAGYNYSPRSSTPPSDLFNYGSANIAVGDRVCKSGYSGGTSCGTVSHISPDGYSLRVHNMNNCGVTYGDSGGVVFKNVQGSSQAYVIGVVSKFGQWPLFTTNGVTSGCRTTGGTYTYATTMQVSLLSSLAVVGLPGATAYTM